MKEKTLERKYLDGRRAVASEAFKTFQFTGTYPIRVHDWEENEDFSLSRIIELAAKGHGARVTSIYIFKVAFIGQIPVSSNVTLEPVGTED